MLISVNPATGEELARFELDTPARLDQVLSNAQGAQAAWRRRPPRERVELLSRMAAALRRNAAALARLISLEMGKPIREAAAEIEKAAATCDVYLGDAPAQLACTPVASGRAQSFIAYEPLGVVLAIMPWNYPVWQAIRAAAPALAAGNALVLKHAANVTGCAKALADLFDEAGAPSGLFGIVLAEPETVGKLIDDPRVAGVTFTGSTEVGARIAARAGAALKKQVLELGGSDPFLVLADADVGAAARVAVRARFTNAGQSCVNAKRFIVLEAVADRFLEAFVAETKALKLGDPLDDATDMGPMARAGLRDVLAGQIASTLADGARCVLGGGPLAGPGCFHEPTILDGVVPGMAAFEQETFGPAAAVVRAASEDDALALANRTAYGLGAAVWSGDVERAERIARDLDAGVIAINGAVASDPRLPFGGVKKSGYGRELGELGLKEFTNVKSITVTPLEPGPSEARP